ncbi:MAG: DNA cytosine methyltransferase, partial [Opitutaceae bacterium]|nr:DNA cytosine methyltransferase [Opitutaceae bacterium]
DPEALAMHEANHPQTRHIPEDVFVVDPVKETAGRRVGLAWFSPDCKHFSKAKGGKPRSKKIRGLAYVVCEWVRKLAKAHGRGPRVIILENVEEFQTWGPLLPDGSLNPTAKGQTFRAFVGWLRRRGYVVEWRELRACDYGAPTIRKRLFLIARCDGRPIVWPIPTHGDPESAEVKAGWRKPWRTAAECIDWTLPCPSIFDRARPLAPATCRRIAKGIMRYVVNNPRPFIVPLTHHDNFRGREITQPMPTITAAHRGEHALVAPVLTEHANQKHDRTFDPQTPLRTQCAEVKGGHFALVQAFLAKHYGGVVGSELPMPVGTVTSTDHHSLVTATLAGVGGRAGQSRPRSADEPMQTVTAKADAAVVRAFLVKYYATDQDPKLPEPMHTVTTKDRFGLVTVAGEEYAIADIGLRMLAPRELFRAQGFPENYRIGDRLGDGLTLTKSAQVRMCGNSVCPPLARALVAANVPEMAAWTADERRVG